MLRNLGRNLRSFAWALILSLSVWVAAVTAADPDEVRVLPTPVAVEIVGQDPKLVITGNIPSQVRLTLRAPQSVWQQMTASPDSIRAVLDLSGLGAGEHRLQLQIQIDWRPVRLVTANPASVLLQLEPLVSQSMTVQTTLSGQPAVGYQAGDLTLDPREVLVTGPASRVSLVTRARLVVNISGIRESVDEQILVQALDENNALVDGVTVQPEAVRVSMPVSRQGGFRDMAVKVVVRGQVAPGYSLDSISVFPPVVTVYSADADLVAGLPGVVETQPVELDAASSNMNLRTSLVLPAGVSVVGQQTVLIEAGVSPVQSSFTLSGQAVEITGLPEGLEAQLSPASVDVIISGPIPTLDTLRPQDVHVTVDLSNLGAGTYQLTPAVQIQTADLDVESVNPGAVEVILTPITNPTSQP